MASLFGEYELHDITLPNRIVMGPMTRAKATPEGVPTPMMATHYAQRSSAGLIISEGTWPERRGQGYFDIPGIATQEQQEAWADVTRAVHDEGGRIFLQMEHTGRVGHEVNNGGTTLCAPSDVPADFQIFTREDGLAPMTRTLHVLSTEEVWDVIDAYGRAAARAKAAGFDGIELHGASGYLPHQFLSDTANLRDDEFGGSPANRTRFMIEVLQRMIDAWGDSHRIGVKISPGILYNGNVENEVEETYSALLEQVHELDLAYVAFQTPESLRSLSGMDNDAVPNGEIWHRFPYEFIRERYRGTVIASGDLTKEYAQNALDAGKADLFVFGRDFMSNPDLVERLENGWPLTPVDMRCGYGGGEEGYNDYPTWAEQQAESRGGAIG